MSEPLRVLVVEDSEDDALLLLRQLRKGGFDPVHRRVQASADMREALSSESWDLVITDYNMPGFDGMAALSVAQELAPDTPCIAISGAIGEESAVELLKSGAGDFIKKGNWARLVPAIHRELRDARTRAERRRAAQALEEAEARYRGLFENAVEGIFMATAEGRFLGLNPAMARIHGYETPEEMMDCVQDIPRDLCLAPPRYEEFMRQLADHGSVSAFEIQFCRKDKTEIWVSLHARPVFDSQGCVELVEGMLEDITLRKRAEQQLLHNAFYDSLTGLPNRALFIDRLERALERARRRREKYVFAVLFLDIDSFKTINESLGHAAGDELLARTAKRLRSRVRSLDTVARFGGDEFAVLLEELPHYRKAVHITSYLQEELAQPYEVAGREVFSSASIGVVLGRPEYASSEEILRDADTAMYRAKAMGRNRFKIFNGKMRSQAVHRLEVESDLRGAVRREEFRVHYQPIVSLAHNQVMGFEALARWQHPTRGLVGPEAFIPLAEETGLIVPIGLWVLRTACAQTKVWQDHFGAGSLTCISVNLSAKQLDQSDLVERVRDILEDTGLDPRCLKLEITESVLMGNPQAVIGKLERLKALGVKLAIDDFGTGYSSLAYLHQFPIDTLKIDRSFISGILCLGKESEIVRTIVSLAHGMGMDVVAEGVETSEQVGKLTGLKCEFGQGYIFSRPVSAAESKVFMELAPVEAPDKAPHPL